MPRYGRRVRSIASYAILLAWTLWIGFPLYWLLASALRRPQDGSGRVTLVPFLEFAPSTESLQRAFVPGSLATLALTNSVIVSVGSACLALVCGAMAGYGLARYQYRLWVFNNDRIRLAFLAQRMFPLAVLAVPYLLLFRGLDLLDSTTGILIGEVGFGTPFLTWLVCDFFKRLPREVEESAMLDGCSRLGVLRHVVVPLSAPGLAAAFTLVFISAWNDYFLALVITFSQSVTLPLYIQAHPQPSVIVASIIPPVIVGLVAQRALVRGLSLGVVDRGRA
jgi:multiple sugar transport system permease protein